MLNYKSFLILFTIVLSVHGQLKCRTTADSKDPKKPCIFPFKFKGEKYFGCPPDPEVKSRRWCSTAVDNRGNHITGKGNFGFCEESCPKHKTPNNFKITGRNVFIPKQDLYAKCKTKVGEQCQFPFKHKGVLHYGCPPDPVEAGERWCSTKVDKDGNHIPGKGFYGLCKKECPNHKPVDDSYGQCSRGEKCRPTVQCSSQFPKTKDLTSRTCQLDDLSPGTCCKDVTKSWGPMSDKVVQSGGLAADTRSFSIPFDAK